MSSKSNNYNKTNGSNALGVGDGNSNNRNQHVNSIEAEYQKIPDRSGWHRFYQEIREKCELHEKLFGINESEKPQNRCLNRYRDVNPYDHSRIIIHRGNVDYINANLVKLDRAERKYILTQGPLEDTVGHFWLMVWEQNTKAILMLNKLMEKKQVKCHLYWPPQKGAENAYKLDEVKLSIELLKVEEYKNYIRRWFKLTDLESNQSREIMQFHYTTWPDFGIPSSPNAFLQFLKKVRDSGALDPDVGPAVVHCSAGIGRSGTFCLVDCCLVLIDKEGEDQVSVTDVLYELRRYRMGLIQTADQLYFSYQAIIEGIKLLKDPAFLEYNEEICESNSEEKHIQEQETPPPLPPRTHSLLPLTVSGGGVGGGSGAALTLNIRGGKPLPKIPASESFNDELIDDNKKAANDKDALNNFINSEMQNAAATENQMSNRPLPPLPKKQQNSLDRVHESDSDENEFYEDDTADDDDSEDELNSDGNDENTGDAKIQNSHHNGGDDLNANNENGSKMASNNKNNIDNSGELGGGSSGFTTTKSNGLDGLNNVNGDKSPENELKRRKRFERQSNIEQKVNEIKRKQREAEDSKQNAKKRRSLITYIAAGVIVGVICVYAYAKLN